MHLVKWEIIKKLVLEGGLQIKDPGMSNLAMGGKLLWQWFSNRKHLVSQLFWKKYLHGGSLRNIQMENTIKGSIIWNSCRKVLEFFVQHVFQEMAERPSCGSIKLMDTIHLSLLMLLLRFRIA